MLTVVEAPKLIPAPVVGPSVSVPVPVYRTPEVPANVWAAPDVMLPDPVYVVVTPVL